MRGLAVLAVIAYHLGIPAARTGWLGVDVFFVLSGFLITILLLGEVDRKQTIALKAFYTRRALRLLPALATVLVFATIAALVFSHEPWSRPTLKGIPWVILYGANWARSFSPDSKDALGILAHTWSLAIEEQFYLIWPALMLVIVRWRKRDRIAMLLLLVALLEMIYRGALLHAGISTYRIADGLDTHSDGLLVGCAIAFHLSASRSRARSAHRRRDALIGIGAAAGMVTLGVLLLTLPGTPTAQGYGYSLAALATGMILLYVVIQPALDGGCQPLGRAFNYIMRWRPLVWIGQRSYGLYLWNLPIFTVLSLSKAAWVSNDGTKLLVVFAVAALSYRLVETPFLRMKARFQSGEPLAASAAPAIPRAEIVPL